MIHFLSRLCRPRGQDTTKKGFSLVPTMHSRIYNALCPLFIYKSYYCSLSISLPNQKGFSKRQKGQLRGQLRGHLAEELFNTNGNDWSLKPIPCHRYKLIIARISKPAQESYLRQIERLTPISPLWRNESIFDTDHPHRRPLDK